MPRINKRAQTGSAAAPGAVSGAEQTTLDPTPSVNDGSISDSDSGNSDSAIDPATVADSGSSGESTRTRKRRSDAGSKRGSRSRGTEKQTSQDLSALLLSLHLMGAAVLKSPELILSDEEAERLGAAIARVNEVYDGIVIPEKQMAWINLGIAACTIYGPRAIAITARKRAEPKTIEAEVIPFGTKAQ